MTQYSGVRALRASSRSARVARPVSALLAWWGTAALLCLAPGLAAADPWKDESGHRGRGGEYKQEYWDGDCKVERKWKRDGRYKEERKCRRPDYGYGYYPPMAVPMPQPEPAIVITPTIVIRP